MSTPCGKGPVCPARARDRAEVRASLAVFAVTNFMIGMTVFMFTLCSSAPHHIKHLRMLFTDFPALVEHLSEGGKSHYDTAH